MKNQFLITCLAAALLAGCSKEAEMLDGSSPATHISAKATGAESPETKAPLTGTSLNGQQAQVYTTVLPLDAYMSDPTAMFTDAYACGTMTFADNSYVMYNSSGFSGKILLPIDKSPLYLYGFYPAGWTPAEATGASGAYESLSRTFDGKTDLMVTWLTASDQQKIAYLGGKSGTLPDKADFLFHHLLTRYNVQIKGNDANALKFWGRIKSISLKDAKVNKVFTSETLGYNYSEGGGVVSFYKLAGTTDTPTYSDDAFVKTAFADMLALTQTYQNACYTMAAPVTVDSSTATPELTLMVVTQSKDGGMEQTTAVPLSIDPTKLSAAIFANNTCGYSITVALNFSGAAIEASTLVEPWKDGSDQTESVKPLVPPAIGDFKDGGIVYWADATDATKYKIFSLTQSQGAWSAHSSYVLGAGDGQDMASGLKNVSAMKAYSAAIATNNTSGVFALDFPAANFCDAMNTGGVTGWYLPAKEELETLLNTYLAHKDVVDGAIADHGGTAIPAGGYFYSGTEDSGSTSNAWSVICMNGIPSSESKTLSYFNIRCVKNIMPPPPVIGEFKDGGVVYWVDPLDATNYKVVSVDERGLSIPSSTSAVIGATHENDGRVNIQIAKNYAAAKGIAFSQFTAFNYCDTKGPGWYVPAKNELKTLYDAYQSNTAIINDALTSNGGTVIPADALLTSTEGTSNPQTFFVLNFVDGQFLERTKTGPSYTRCIKSTVPSPPMIGELKDGGIIYEVTGANYKVFSLDQSKLKSAAYGGYSLESSADAKDQNDAWKNIAAMKAYSAAHTSDVATGDDATETKTTGTFATDFPAAGWCESKGKGWHLPSLNELKALYGALTGADKTTIETAIATNSATAFVSTAPGDEYWTTTESDYPGQSAPSYVHFTSGLENHYQLMTAVLYVRCIKSTVPPPPPPLAIGDLKDGGIVYRIDPADATNYKVVSLVEPTDTGGAGKQLEWGPFKMTDVNGDERGTTDGRLNTQAMLAYSTNNVNGTKDFSADFPAVAYCYNYQGKAGADAKGTWYLPAKDEAEELWTQWKNNSAIAKSIATQGGIELFSVSVLNGYMTSTGVGGNGGATMYYLDHTTGSASWSAAAAYNVRCIRRSK